MLDSREQGCHYCFETKLDKFNSVKLLQTMCHFLFVGTEPLSLSVFEILGPQFCSTATVIRAQVIKQVSKYLTGCSRWCGRSKVSRTRATAESNHVRSSAFGRSLHIATTPRSSVTLTSTCQPLQYMQAHIEIPLLSSSLSSLLLQNLIFVNSDGNSDYYLARNKQGHKSVVLSNKQTRYKLQYGSIR